jgi:hypothetical protein
MILATHGIIANTTLPSTLNNGILSAYKAENNANDSLGLYNGTAQGGLTYSSGKSGQAFDFNGTNSYIDYGDVLDIGTNSWTYSFWTIPKNQSFTKTFFSKGNPSAGAGRLYVFSSGNLLVVGFQVNGSQTIEVRCDTTVIPNSWAMITIIIDRNDKIKCYINGTLLTLTTLFGTNNLIPYISVNYNITNPFRIGAYALSGSTTPTFFAESKIDEFSIWNRVLTPTEITELYNSSNGKFYPY